MAKPDWMIALEQEAEDEREIQKEREEDADEHDREAPNWYNNYDDDDDK